MPRPKPTTKTQRHQEPQAADFVSSCLRGELSSLPVDLQFGAEPCNFLASAETAANGGGRPRVQGTAYSGGIIFPCGTYGMPAVVELSSMTVAPGPRPLLFEHDSRDPVGHTTEITAAAAKITVAGVLSCETDSSNNIASSGRNGFPWRLSIGGRVRAPYVRVEEGQVATVNGHSFKGPFLIAKKFELREISFLTDPGDDRTNVRIAATGRSSSNIGVFSMKFSEWLLAKGFDPNTISEAQKTTLQAAFDAEQRLTASGQHSGASSQEPGANGSPLAADSRPLAATPSEDPLLALRARHAAELERMTGIQTACGSDCPELQARAVREGWDVARAQGEAVRERELRSLRSGRPGGPAIHVEGHLRTPEVLEAAFARSSGLPAIEKHYTAPILEAADRHFRNVGLQEVLLQAAAANGHHGRQRISANNIRQVLQAAFATNQITTMLTTVGNKLLLAGFTAVPQSWRQVAEVRPVNDFKQTTAFRLTSSLEYEEVGPGGSIPLGTLGQESYTLQARTYAKLATLSRQDVINDDLGCLNDLRKRLGLGGAIKLNNLFWSTWLTARNAGTFWTAARGNLVTSAALGEAGLNKAVQAFRDLKVPEPAAGANAAPSGSFMELEPDRILVPSALESTARKLYTSQEVRDTTSSTLTLTANIHQNRFKPVVVPQLGNSAFTGSSATTWHLLCDPAILASAIVCFLNGQESPTVEECAMDCDTLGVCFRGYHDFGVSMSEYRGSTQQNA